jgi:hypothetical protein
MVIYAMSAAASTSPPAGRITPFGWFSEWFDYAIIGHSALHQFVAQRAVVR